MRTIAVSVAISALAATGVEAQEERRRVAPPDVYAVAPGLGHFTDDVLFGDVWQRPDLAARDRSLGTMTALIAIGQPEQLPFHAKRAMDNGLTATDVSEVLTQVAFTAGWPGAMSAVPVLKQALENRKGTDVNAPKASITITPAGSDAAPAPDAYFTGHVQISGRYQADAPARVGGATVSFAAGARTAWHTHPLGQTLFIVSGRGWVQKDGEPVQDVGPGDVVWIPPLVRHWHGATTTDAMAHFAMAEAQDGSAVTWMEKVSDEEYGKTRQE